MLTNCVTLAFAVLSHRYSMRTLSVINPTCADLVTQASSDSLQVPSPVDISVPNGLVISAGQQAIALPSRLFANSTAFTIEMWGITAPLFPTVLFNFTQGSCSVSCNSLTVVVGVGYLTMNWVVNGNLTTATLGGLGSSVQGHMVLTYSPTNGSAVLYLRGAPALSIVSMQTACLDPRLFNDNTFGGGLDGSKTFGFSGSVMELRLWSYPMTAADVKASYLLGDSGLGNVSHFLKVSNLCQ